MQGTMSSSQFRRPRHQLWWIGALALVLTIGGETRTIEIENEPHYTSIYELESPEVLVSEAWAEAIERGRWSREVRPFTMNARRVLVKRVQGR